MRLIHPADLLTLGAADPLEEEERLGVPEREREGGRHGVWETAQSWEAGQSCVRC